MAVRRVLLRVQAAGEHDPRDLLLEQQLDVLRLGHAARGLGAQDRREPALREGDAHDLGERREDRVLELRQHEADEARALAPELGRPLVAHDVERGEHRLTRGVRDAGLAVEHAAHRGLAHADLARHLGESSCHAVMLRKFATAVCRLAQAGSRGMIWRMSLRHHEIAEANHRILNPFTEEKLRLLGEVTGVAAGTRVLDLACGKGELLCRWAEWFGSGGVGVDLSPVFLGAAVARAAELGVADRLTFIQGDAGTYEPEPGAFDVAACIGATWIGGGLAGHDRRCCVRRSAAAGRILIGEPYWIEPPPDEAVEALGFGADEFVSLEGTLDRLEAADVELVEMVLADGDSWDRYEAAAVADDRGVAGRQPRRSGPRRDARVPRRRPPQPTCAGAAATSAGASSSPARADAQRRPAERLGGLRVAAVSAAPLARRPPCRRSCDVARRAAPPDRAARPHWSPRAGAARLPASHGRHPRGRGRSPRTSPDASAARG